VSNPVKRLLIVEDDVRVRDLAVFAARRSQYFNEVATASDGVEALRMIRHLQGNDEWAGLPDVILTDLRMPRMDGVQLVRALKADPEIQSVPMFMFSSFFQAKDRERALAAGCEEFYEKPISLEGLVAIMSTIGARLGQTAPRQ